MADIHPSASVASSAVVTGDVTVGAESRALHVGSRLAPGSVVPIGWIAAGDPAQLFSPGQHETLWRVQEPLDFPGTVYGVERGTSMGEIMRRQCDAYRPA